MKRMELKISLTFAIMFVIGVVINGIYSVTAMDSSFFTFDVVASGLLYAMFFLLYIYINTRRHQLLAWLGLLSISGLLLLIIFSSEGVSGTFSGWNWKDTISCVYYIIAYIIASHQGEELLKEDKETININIRVKGKIIKPEDVEITRD